MWGLYYNTEWMSVQARVYIYTVGTGMYTNLSRFQRQTEPSAAQEARARVEGGREMVA
jgi:hypothetical protein